VSNSLFGRAIAGVLNSIKKERKFFDRDFYTTSYADVRSAGVDAFQHYMEYGWREGRNPSRGFNTLYYRDRHLAGAEENPLSHYARAGGKSSGLAPSAPSEEDFVTLQRTVVVDVFDRGFYECQVTAVSQDLMTHYLTVGWRDGISPSPTFDVKQYYSENSYVKALDVSPLYHFASQSRMRSRTSAPKPTSVRARDPIVPTSGEKVKSIVAEEFDRTYYLSRNEDIKNAGADPLLHFLEFGWRERRNPNSLFDVTYYLAANPDVVERKINPFFHYLTEGRTEGRKANPAGSHPYPPLRAPSREAWDKVSPAAATDDAEYIVVMPVYKGYDETLASIHSVLVAKQAVKFALHVINDVSPDVKLEQTLADLAERGLFSYSKNDANLGFVKSVNLGLRRFSDKEVVLLNADATVFGDWLDRMDAHAKRHPTIATITPMSNNATICSYPVINQNNLIELERSAAELDQMAACCNVARISDIPTGVGFCFYMRRASRDAVGLFDEQAFGRGYGEENDFCLRAAKAGFRNVLAEDIFVYHVGEISFAEYAGDEYRPGQKALLRKHPDYAARVRHHLEADDSERGRMRLDLFRLAKDAGPDSMIFVSHALSGGVATHIEQMEKRLRDLAINVVHIRVGVKNRWSIEIASGSKTAPYCPNLRPISFNQIRSLLREFLAWLNPMAIHIHSLVGFDWVATQGFLDLVRNSGLPYYFTLHDYSEVCHRSNLVAPNNQFCGLPDVSACQLCVSGDRSYPEAIDPVVRRRAYDDFLQGAAAVFAPSDDIRKRLEAAGASYEIALRPHEEPPWDDAPVMRPPRKPKLIDIVAIGAIGPHKGSRVLLNLAREAKARSLPIRYHIVGYSDLTSEMTGAGVTETGRYDSETEAIDWLTKIKPSCVFLPSIWPETFCFTLSMAFALEIPPVVFDLGAQAERVRAANFGFVLPYGLIDDIRSLNNRLCELPYADAFFDPCRFDRKPYVDVLRDYYALNGAFGRSSAPCTAGPDHSALSTSDLGIDPS
jgi:GT2 family glycosyltransferase/glycosyltransferase involved in cell wall biosynthesis